MDRLLIVEDDEDLREGLEFSFRSEGYEVTTAAAGKDALNYLKKNTCDVIPLDCNLPDGNGFDLAADIRKNSGNGLYKILPVTLDFAKALSRVAKQDLVVYDRPYNFRYFM